MADHLRLPPAVQMETKRVPSRFDPNPPPFDRGRHATTLRGVLEGLESGNSRIFKSTAELEDDGIDASELGEVVLKVSGTVQFKSGAFGQWRMIPLAANDDKQFFVLSDADSRSAFRELTRKYGTSGDWDSPAAWREILDNIENIELYDRSDRVAPDLVSPDGHRVVEVDVVLWPTSIATRGATTEGARRVKALTETIEAFAQGDPRVGVLAFDDVHTDTLLIHARLNSAAFEAVADHAYVEHVRGPLHVQVTTEDLSNGSEPNDSVLPEGAPIGIIDDLIVDENPWLAGVVTEQRSFPDGYEFGDHTSHGTQVAGMAAWGNVRKLLLDPNYDGQPHPIYLARVAQSNEHFEAEIVGNPVQQISDALDWFASKGVTVVVLALGQGYADDGPIPSDLSSTIDRKIRELGLVVVSAAGNITEIDGDWKADYPAYLRDSASKVSAPGSAALALTVGSVAHTEAFDRGRWPNGISIAKVAEAAPYSRTGPSRAKNSAGRQKPEFAGHGGAWALDQGSGNLIRGDAELGAITLIPPRNGRLFGVAAGTSYAASLIAHEVARIQTRYPEASANLLRALTALAGDRPPTALSDPSELLVGMYGTPDADRVLESGENRVIFLYEGAMPTNSHCAIEIPIPPEFAAGVSERELRVSLAFDPPVRRSRRDYIAGRMTYDLIHKASLDEIRQVYARQPTAKELAEDSARVHYDLLKGQNLRPPKTRLSADTLICRSYATPTAGWDEDDRNYHLVITHEHSPWTETQKREYPTQGFAVAVQIADLGRPQLDIFALAEARLTARIRGRGEAQ